jgi:hypothetical protein
MTRFWIDRGDGAVALTRAEDVRPFLADPDTQWRRGFSAAELAHAWIDAGGLPDAAARLLAALPDLEGAELEAGLFEHQTRLRSRGRPSQTDLLALVRGRTARWVVAVEGKRDEPFGPRVRDWNDGPGKAARLAELCDLLALAPADVVALRYQLFHRTAAALLEAERRDIDAALLLVHSFSPQRTSFDDFAAFAHALGAPVRAPGELSPGVRRHGCRLHLAWLHDPRDAA